MWHSPPKKGYAPDLFRIIQQFAAASALLPLPKLLLQPFGRMGN
jgi:hypothetical protein